MSRGIATREGPIAADNSPSVLGSSSEATLEHETRLEVDSAFQQKSATGFSAGATLDEDKTPVPDQTTTEFDGYPDGGRAAWLSVLGCWCAMASTFGWVQSVGQSQIRRLCVLA
jgi:hypothetical protein